MLFSRAAIQFLGQENATNIKCVTNRRFETTLTQTRAKRTINQMIIIIWIYVYYMRIQASFVPVVLCDYLSLCSIISSLMKRTSWFVWHYSIGNDQRRVPPYRSVKIYVYLTNIFIYQIVWPIYNFPVLFLWLLVFYHLTITKCSIGILFIFFISCSISFC